jgi:Nucleotide-diphospho-sugar transferase
VPYHLWAKPSVGVWNSGRKPAVVLETLDAYPGKTVVLMDVDCVARSDITPVAQIDADVGIVVIARDMRKGRKLRHWIPTECSSRIVVFRSTEGARNAFARRWAERIERSGVAHDEHAMVWAMLDSLSTTSFSYIDQRDSARETGQIADALIEHDSAHDEARRASRVGGPWAADGSHRPEAPPSALRPSAGKFSALPIPSRAAPAVEGQLPA